MKQTFMMTMPDQTGVFLKAGRVLKQRKLNITRVSYNQSIDAHTVFIEVEGASPQLEPAAEELKRLGCLREEERQGKAALLEFLLKDEPGSVVEVLELIAQYRFPITYISSQENGTARQKCKVGIYVEKPEKLAEFLSAAQELCPVQVLEPSGGGVFYASFTEELAEQLQLGEQRKKELAVAVNQVMQLLDERGESYQKTFSYIRGYAEALAQCRGENFHPRVSEFDFGSDLHMILIEPPCGSNTAILRHQGQYLYIDTGYACYRSEMVRLLRRLLPDFDTAPRTALITHADMDHCGLLELFDTVFLSQKSRDSLVMERTSNGGLRDRNPLHRPYTQISRLLTSYEPPAMDALTVIAGISAPQSELLEELGSLEFGTLSFRLYEGQGGHLPGELVLVEREKKLVFTGDILINIKDLTPEQANHNHYAPFLMTSVDFNPALCARERSALPGILGPGTWNVFGGHGPRRLLTVEPEAG